MPVDPSFYGRADEIEAKREQLLAFVDRFHRADDHVGGMQTDPDVTREWLDQLFTLNAELQALVLQASAKRRTTMFAVEITKGSGRRFPDGVKKS